MTQGQPNVSVNVLWLVATDTAHLYATISPIFSAIQPTQIKLALDCHTAPSKHQGKSSHKFRRLRKTIISNLTFVLVTYTKTLFQPYATISSIFSAKQPTQIKFALDSPKMPLKYQGKSGRKFRQLRKTMISNWNTEHPERWHLWLICHKGNVNWLWSHKNGYPNQNCLRLSYNAIEASRQKQPYISPLEENNDIKLDLCFGNLYQNLVSVIC